MIPNYVQIDMVIVSINTGNHTISLNKHTIGLEIYNSTRQYTFRPEVCGTNFFNPVPNPGLSKFPNQNQIQNRDSDLIQNKTKSKTETQIWFKAKPNPKPRLRFDSKQNQIQNRD